MAVHQFRYADYLKGGFGLVKTNLVPCAVGAVVMGIPLVGLVLGPTVAVNLMRGFKESRASGKPIEIGDLFKLDNLVPNLIAGILNWLGFLCCCIPGVLVMFSLPIMAEKPGTDPMNAVKGAFAFGKQNIVGLLILAFAFWLVSFLGLLPLIILNVVLSFVHRLAGLLVMPLFLAVSLVLTPLLLAALWLAFEDAKP